jgi:hypothetical protein
MTFQEESRMFEIKIDMAEVYPIIKGFKLREYSSLSPTISVTATSPDNACFLVYKNLRDLLISQKADTKVLEIVKSLISIKSIKVKND